MGAIDEGMKAGKSSGKKAGARAGKHSDPEGNGFKEGARSAGKGAAGGAMGGAAKGAVKGAGSGMKDGAKVGGKIGGSIPYAGAVLGPLGAVAGGAIGGAGGAALGGTSGALSGAGSGAKSGAEESNKKRKENKPKKLLGSLKDNIKGAIQHNIKDIIILKLKLIIIVIVIIFIIISAFVYELTGKAESVSVESMGGTFETDTSEAATMYKENASLILANDEQLQKISDSFFEEMDSKNDAFYDALKVEYSGKKSKTVANKVKHVTTDFSANTVEEVPQIAETASSISGMDSLDQKRTIYDHILRTEKYNFNNIVWRSYVKSGSGVKSANMTFQLDSDSKLQYPSKDNADTDKDIHDLSFYISKARPYLQTWYIPFDLATGTQSGEASEGNINTKFAYEILASAYHEVTFDRYKIETLTRNTNYLVYDKTTTATTTTRKCGKYEIVTGTETLKKKGDKCDATDYAAGLCKDYKMTFEKKDLDPRDSDSYKKYFKDNPARVVNCADNFDSRYCNYGVLKKDQVQDKVITRTLCVDTHNKPTVNVEKDQRESKSVSKDADNTKYRWDYVISMAKTFDTVISNDYQFEAFHVYSTNNYYNFIKKKDARYNGMTVDGFQDMEKTDSKSDSFSHTDKDYYDTETDIDNINSNWNSKYLVEAIPSGAKKVEDIGSKEVYKETKVVKDGKEYEDIYVWNDKLNFEGTKSGIYNVESVKDVTGDDLDSTEIEYYDSIYLKKELNLVDLINSNDKIYKNYMSSDKTKYSSNNIGYRKSYLLIGYDTLKNGLKKLAENFPMSGLGYGTSLGVENAGFSILNGVNFGDVANIAAGSLEGKNVAWPIEPDSIKNSYVQIGSKYGNSYGYAGHTGVDISYAYAAADKSLCNDFTNQTCPYIKGSGIYTSMDGKIKEVGYSAYNKHYGVGQYVGNAYEGKLRISDTSGWGCYVKIDNVDGTSVIYAHMFPDKEFYKKMADSIGQDISAGTFIGYMGNTGSSSGLHLHIEFGESAVSLGGGRTNNSSLTYIYLSKIMNTMGVSANVT